MKNQLENKAGMIKCVNVEHNGVVGLHISSGTGTGLAKLCQLPEVSAPNLGLHRLHSWGQKYVRLTILSKGLSLAAFPGSWLSLKRQAVVAKGIWKQNGALMLRERAVPKAVPSVDGSGFVLVVQLSEEGLGGQSAFLLPFTPCARASLCPQEDFRETQ